MVMLDEVPMYLVVLLAGVGVGVYLHAYWQTNLFPSEVSAFVPADPSEWPKTTYDPSILYPEQKDNVAYQI